MKAQVFTAFVNALKEMPHEPPHSSKLGLVSLDPGSVESAESIYELLSYAFPTRRVAYDQTTHDRRVLEQIVSSLECGEWVLLDLRKELSGPVYDMLMHLGRSKTLRLYNFRGESLFRMPLPKTSGIVVCAERTFIEIEQTSPSFYGIFGPAVGV